VPNNPFGINSKDPFGLSTSSKKNTERDSRRAFIPTQKNEIRYQQNEKCAECHDKLDSRDIEFDHKKAWASGGRTKTVNGRAVCGSCHNKITHKQNLKKADKKIKSKTNDILGVGDFKLPKFKPPKFF